MEIKEGYVYVIKDEFFKLADDPKLQWNKDGNRPTYLCEKDKDGLLWFVPMSSQLEKYESKQAEEIAKFGESVRFFIGKYANRKSAFLFQNMFPASEKYIERVYTIRGNAVPVDEDMKKKLDKTFRKVMHLHKKGIKIIYPDIDRIKKLVLSKQEHGASNNNRRNLDEIR